jgi:hypothetical protein
MGAGVGIPHNHRVAGPDESLFREKGMADAVGADVEKVLYSVAVSPVTQNFCLCSGLRVLAWSDMVNYSLDFTGVEDPVLTSCHKVIDRNRGSDFVTHDDIKFQHLCALKRLINQMCCKNLFRGCFTHMILIPFMTVLFSR